MHELDQLRYKFQMLMDHLGLEFATCPLCKGNRTIPSSHPAQPDDCPDCYSYSAYTSTGMILQEQE